MAPNVLAKPNARSLLLLAGAADILAARHDYEVINDFFHALKVPGSMFDLSSIFRVTKKFRATSNRSELILGCLILNLN